MSRSSASGTATARLRADYMRIKRDPVPYIFAEPLPSNILEWHYMVKGPEQSPYDGGYYHGKLVFPMEYPFKPPSIYMLTPSGRFKTNTKLCLSISDFHPDTWNPAWSVATILTGLLSFMLERAPTFGSIETSDFEKRQFAAQSLPFNAKSKVLAELFPTIMEEIQATLAQRERDSQAARELEQMGSSGSSLTAAGGIASAQGQHVSALTNLAVLVSFALFAFAVKHVLKSLGDS